VRAGASSPWHRAALAAALGISLDLTMEPVAARLGLWEWTPHGPWLDVPIGNFVGWAVIVGGYTLGAELWPGTGAFVGDALRRITLGAAAIAALVAVGLAWKATNAERLFEGPGGWITWAALAASPLLLARAHTGASTAAASSFAARLGATPGAGPALVFAVVGSTFAIDALTLGGRDLALVATVTSLVLASTFRYRRTCAPQKRAPDSLGPQAPPELPT